MNGTDGDCDGDGGVENPLMHEEVLRKDFKPPDEEECTFPKLLEVNELKDDKASEYDLCMVFETVKNSNGECCTLSRSAQVIVQKLVDNKLDVFLVYSLRKNFIFVLIRASLQLLRSVADEHQFKMLLDKEVLQQTLEKGNEAADIPPVSIPHEPEESSILPYEYISGRYRTEIDESLYWRPSDISHPFRESVRLKLTLIILELPPPCGGGSIKVRKQIEKGIIKSFFPLHNLRRKKEISDEAMKLTTLPWNMPTDRIKEYFGEKIGLYFNFMGHFSKWLIAPAVIGFPLQIYILVKKDYENPVQIGFAIFIVLWAIFMLEFWKRKEKMTALYWGMIDFEKNEVNRPEFKGAKTKSFVDGKEVYFFSDKQRKPLIYQSMVVIGVMICLVIGVVISIYIIRNALSKSIGSQAQIVASMLADYLTERENHRTDTEFEDSMIAKTFLFQFVNSFASFFYIAFIAKSQPRPSNVDDASDEKGDCGSVSCMRPLAANLAIIFFTRVTIGNIMELALPLLRNNRIYDKEKKLANGASFIRAEEEFLLAKYDIMKATISDYAEVVINFGYITLFAVALPAVGLIASAANWLEIKGDTWKLLAAFQRPLPRGAEDIGQWQDILMILSIVGNVTNAGIAVFTMDVLDDYTDMFRMWFFVLFQWICFITQVLIMAAVPDEPHEITIQVARSEYMTQKAVRQIPDDILGGECDLSKEFEYVINSYVWKPNNVRASFADSTPDSAKKDI